MKPLDRDIHILEHIVSYCQQIEETVARFGNDGSIFSSDPIYRNAAALCILQIGELVGKLSEEFQFPGVKSKPCGILSHIVMVP